MSDTISPHSPAPWHANTCEVEVVNEGGVSVRDSDGEMVCDAFGSANAHLIAAAPEQHKLLVDCEAYIREYCESTDPSDPAHELLVRIKDVLVKVEGKEDRS
jgi:hypothetical protein